MAYWLSADALFKYIYRPFLDMKLQVLPRAIENNLKLNKLNSIAFQALACRAEL
jgi:hypothetical protein